MSLSVLTKLFAGLMRFRTDQRGSVVIEYGVVIMFIAVSLIGTAQILAGRLNAALFINILD